MSSRFLIGEGLPLVENSRSLPLEDHDLQLYRGWNDEIAQQLVERSKEEEIRRFTGNDAAERFVDVVSAYDWYRSKGHVVYALGQKAALAGVAWFSHTPRPELGADYTFAIRMYDSQRGKGLAGALLEAAHKDFESAARYEGTIWLEANEDNQRALRFYEKHGYGQIETKDGRVLMVRKGTV
jgi:ribosomal protein S18 acetylase RimI-like enzyme